LWSIDIIRPSVIAEKFSGISDVLIEINAVGQPHIASE
jgi:hypothetical protein